MAAPMGGGACGRVAFGERRGREVSKRKEMMGDYKHCPGCDQWVHREHYHKHSKRHTGLSDHCKLCSSIYIKKYYRENRERVKRKTNEYRRTLIGHANALILSARSRARNVGLVFSIDADWVVARLKIGVCNRSGLPFAPPRSGGRKALAASIDRIEAAKGYTRSNSQLVCDMYNMGKNQFDELDFIAMCVAVAERHADDPCVITRLKELRGE